MNNEIKTTSLPAESRVPTHFCKSNFFRVVHADGVWGGGTPSPENLMMTFFSHRIPFPDQTTLKRDDGVEITQERIVKQGIERELEVSIVMNLTTAKSFHGWLAGKIKMMEEKQTNANKL